MKIEVCINISYNRMKIKYVHEQFGIMYAAYKCTCSQAHVDRKQYLK